MRYKLSNMATVKQLEQFAGAKFLFPKIYKPNAVYTGLEEELLPIITQENKNDINYGIWGILPHNYKQDWQEFQNLKQTLTVVHNDIKYNSVINSDCSTKRCVILVTGFFTNFLHKGKLYPHIVYTIKNKPFYVAGYYNTLQDGFLTVTMVIKKKSHYLIIFST